MADTITKEKERVRGHAPFCDMGRQILTRHRFQYNGIFRKWQAGDFREMGRKRGLFQSLSANSAVDFGKAVS